MTTSTQHAVEWLFRQPEYFCIERPYDSACALSIGEHSFVEHTPEEAIEAAYEELVSEPARQQMFASEKDR